MRPQNAVVVGDVDGLDLLGRMVTYTHPDDPKPASKVIRCWAKHGLNVDDLPDVRTTAHRFQSACRSVEQRRRDSKAGVEVKVDEVTNNAAEVVYQITRLVRDKQAQIIEHPKAMTLRLDKKLDTISCRELEDYEALRPLEEKVREHFAAHEKDLPGQKIRNSIRAVVEGIGGQNMRGKPGGLYFVPDTYRGENGEVESLPVLEGLRGFVADTYGDRGDFWWLNVASDAMVEDMIAKRFSINAADKSRELLERAVARAAAGMGERGIREDFMTGLYQEQRKLMGAVQQYEQLVSLDRKEITANLTDLDNAIRKLEAMREEGKK